MGDTSIGFTQLFTQIMRIFQIAYAESQVIWNFLITPLKETLGDEFVGMMGEDIAELAPLEFMVGAGLIIAIIYAMVKFFIVP